MSNHLPTEEPLVVRKTRYKGFTIAFVHERGLWWRSITRDRDGYDFGGGTIGLPWTTALDSAKAVCDDIITNPDHYED